MLFEESGIIAAYGKERTYTVIGAAVIKNGLHKRPVLVLFIIQVILILACVLQIAVVNGNLLDILFCFMMDPNLDFDQDLADKSTACDVRNNVWATLLGWPGNLSLVIGDSVVVWRAWTLWEHHTGVQWMLVIFGICNGVANIVANLYSSISDITDPTIRMVLQKFYLILSLVLNILATMLIAYKIWLVLWNLKLKHRNINGPFKSNKTFVKDPRVTHANWKYSSWVDLTRLDFVQ
ncbi:hypothetical protein BDP27DRAFT_1369023 [Rhodocollybia butyracea]|uniref:Uncharacterized protein n=1 Tax=Rhodocollybia butyracea TaxID=206335 RepID=A0A9P5U0T6_9AGAR|nr:hypothetical protein BDP27DRAFT_1369023 [Rhodocollybia butyracea]